MIEIEWSMVSRPPREDRCTVIPFWKIVSGFWRQMSVQGEKSKIRSV
jgi:hypothetical protein